ncbi:hypothetical protein KKH27_13540 [bacterium]|nr:hypothetical protein [bacterium]
MAVRICGFILFVGFLACSAMAQEWHRLAPSPQNRDLRSITFTESGVGWAAGDGGTLLCSTDDGLSWVSRPIGTSAMLLSVFFLNEQVGWIAGGAVSGGG